MFRLSLRRKESQNEIKYLPANRIFMSHPSGLFASYSHVVLRDRVGIEENRQFIATPLAKLLA